MKRRSEPPLVAAAQDLLGGVEDLERLSARIAETNLPTWKAIARAGEQMGEAVQAHQRFATALGSLSDLVSGLRERHNRAADVLAAEAARLEERRVAYQAFEGRFAVLAQAARQTDELLRAIPHSDDPATHVAAVAAGIAGVREHLGRAAEEARALAADAQAAGFTDLRQQADEVRAQLEAMIRKSASAAPDA
jgi:ABC-type transporter Mla subunit MlaD